ncbi:MAG TPA: efflux RND transporter periplasmic adaptor subunit [bacterium]
MEKKKRNLLIVGGAILLILIIAVVAAKKKGGGMIVVQTEKVAKGRVVSTVSGSAKIQPEIQVKISAKVSGQIIQLGVKEGDSVKKGQFLCQLDPEFYRAAVEQTESNLKFAMAGFEKAKNEYERSKQLFNQNLISQAELDIVKSAYEQAKSQVEQTQAGLKQERDNLAKTTMYSPMNGTVSQLNKKVGEMAMGSQFTLDVIMVVADLTRMLAETDIDENDVVEVSIGDTAKIQIDAYPDTTFKGVVTEIANTGTTTGQSTQEEITNFLIKVLMTQKPGNVKPSMSATVDITTDSRADVLKLPIQCITNRPPLKPKATAAEKGKSKTKPAKSKPGQKPDSVKTESKKDEKPINVVFVVKNGLVHQVAIATGISSDTDYEIKSGLKEGDEIVSGPFRVLSKQLKDGDKVRVSKSTGTPAKGNS